MIMLFVWSVVVAAIGFVVTVLSAVMLYRYVGQLGRDQLRMMQDEGFTLSGLLGRIAVAVPSTVTPRAASNVARDSPTSSTLATR